MIWMNSELLLKILQGTIKSKKIKNLINVEVFPHLLFPAVQYPRSCTMQFNDLFVK